MCKNTCIFIPLHGCFEKCQNKTFKSSQYCKNHYNKQRYIFNVLDESVCSKDLFLNLYSLMNYIYNNDTYDYDLNEMKKNNLEYKKSLFVHIIHYIFSRKTIDNYLNSIKFRKKTSNKIYLITCLHDIIKNTIYINQYHSDKIIILQRFLRQKLYKIVTKYSKSASENQQDPFTFEDILSIPEKMKFGYKDSNERVYIFDAVELEYYIRNHSNCNPYTKEKIPNSVINRLNIFIKYNHLQKKLQNDIKWQTPLQAYTDVSLTLEKAGFYNDVKWFENISYRKCVNIICAFKDISSQVQNVNEFFEESFDISENDYHFGFAKEIIKLFSKYDDNYLLCCNFIKALALYSNAFYENLPQWILDIESPSSFPQILLNNNDMFFIYYVYSNLLNDNI